MHVMVIPSWYGKKPDDPTGSFFREQAIALSKYVNKVGVLVLEQLPIHSFLTNKKILPEVSFYKDDSLFTAKLTSYNYTPRFEFGIALQWRIKGLNLFRKYKEEYGMPDVIHAHCSLYGGFLAAEISRKFNIPYIVTEHSSMFVNKKLDRFGKRVAEKVYLNSKKNIAVSNFLKSFIEEQFPAVSSFEVLPNIVNENFFKVDVSKKCVGSRIKVVNIGLLLDVKNQVAILNMLNELRSRRIDNISVDIIGGGPLAGFLQDKINELGLQPHVRLLGSKPRTEIPQILADADIFILTSHHETFGVVVAEALAVGVPCIVTPCGGPNEFVNEDDGIISHSVSAHSLANSFIELLQKKNFGDVDCKCQRRLRAKERFSGDVVSLKLLNLLSQASKEGI